MKHLHTGQFKQVYKEVKTPLPHLNFLILGFLVWLEQLYLDYTIKANLDSAIDDYHKQMDRLENDRNLWGRYTTHSRADFPRCQPCYYRHVSRNASRENHESQRNKDATVDSCVAICWRSSRRSLISVLDSQSCATHVTQIICVGLIKSHDNLRMKLL